MSANDWWNRNVFSCPRKEGTHGADCTSSGRVFQKMEAATGNERRPAVDRRYCLMCSCSVNDDRRRRRPGMLDTGTSWLFALDSKAECDHLNLAHETKTNKASAHLFSTGWWVPLVVTLDRIVSDSWASCYPIRFNCVGGVGRVRVDFDRARICVFLCRIGLQSVALPWPLFRSRRSTTRQKVESCDDQFACRSRAKVISQPDGRHQRPGDNELTKSGVLSATTISNETGSESIWRLVIDR